MTYGTNEACGCQTDAKLEPEESEKDITQIMGREMSLLVAAGAAMGANSEACLNKVVSDLTEAGVPEEQIRGAVVIGQMVKDKPARRMKEAADVLTGSTLSGNSADRLQSLSVISKWGSPNSVLWWINSFTGTGVWPASIQICQSTFSWVKPRW